MNKSGLVENGLVVYTFYTKNKNISEELVMELQGIKKWVKYMIEYHYRKICNETCAFVIFLL